ncbi:hypothetical protein [Paraburkholderia oxyphila]|uniref:hypothetical protein n=1 Tax=Paraburkholderia oxyphila TaxID=614212 RepID=UPI0004866F0E|nr:hypothetical protein [Paraburkholderia oxyphila]
MRSLHPDLKSLLNIFRSASADETHFRRRKPEPELATELQAHIVEDILWAWVLMSRIESSGVRLPVQISEILVQAWAAYEQNRWTLQVDRSFCSTLKLLESVARRRKVRDGNE